MPDDYETGLWLCLQTTQFEPFPGAVQVERIGAIPDIIHGYSVAAAFRCLQRENSVFSRLQNQAGISFMQGAVFSSQIGGFVMHGEEVNVRHTVGAGA